MIIYSFSGSGKTYLGKKYEQIVDLEPIGYRWVYPETILHIPVEERKKNQERTQNPAWPGNYLKDILYYHHNGSIVLIGGSRSTVDWLEEHEIPCLVLVPTPDQKQEYLDRFKERGNSDDYIRFWDEHFVEYVVGGLSHKNLSFLFHGEYLEDALKRLHILA